MRVFAHVVLIGTLAGWVLAHPARPAAQAPGRDPAPILAAAREALGGEKRLSGVKNFIATGRTRQVRGDNLVPIAFDIAVALPDNYVRTDGSPAPGGGGAAHVTRRRRERAPPPPGPRSPGGAGGSGPGPGWRAAAGSFAGAA